MLLLLVEVLAEYVQVLIMFWKSLLHMHVIVALEQTNNRFEAETFITQHTRQHLLQCCMSILDLLQWYTIHQSCQSSKLMRS